MSQFSYKNFYRRNLPHIQPEGATLFITFRLANSLPKEVIERLLAEKEQAEEKINQLTDKMEREKQLYVERRRYFGKWDEALDTLNHVKNIFPTIKLQILLPRACTIAMAKYMTWKLFVLCQTMSISLIHPLKRRMENIARFPKLCIL